MINRELIRTKIVQLTYAYYQNGSKNIESAEKELIFSLSKAYDLYNYLLALIVGITGESRRHLEVAQSRAKREGTPMPSQKFAYNRFAMQLEGNKMLLDFMENQKKTWNDEPEFLKKLYLQITESQIYKDYMADEEDSYDADRELWRKLYRTLIQNNESLDALLEDGLYLELARNAVERAEELKRAFREKGYRFYLESPTNQQFLILENERMAALAERVAFLAPKGSSPAETARIFQAFIDQLGSLGLMFLMALAGMEADFKLIKSARKPVAMLSILTFAVPAVTGSCVRPAWPVWTRASIPAMPRCRVTPMLTALPSTMA